jgi:hypothetical protein
MAKKQKFENASAAALEEIHTQGCGGWLRRKD